MKKERLISIGDFPNLRQSFSYDCGATAVQAILAYYGINTRKTRLLKITKTNKSGMPLTGFDSAAREYDLKYKTGIFTLEDIKEAIRKRKPTIISIQAWPNKKITDYSNVWSEGHFVIPIAYDDKNMYFEDPSTFNRTYLPFKDLEKQWHDEEIIDNKKVKLDHWGIMFYGKKPKYNSKKAIKITNKIIK